MVQLEKIRSDMQMLLERDKNIQSVDVNADSIDEALSDAAVQLDTMTYDLEYEVLEKGAEGFWGIGKKPWKLRIYRSPEPMHHVKKSVEVGLTEKEKAEVEKIVDKDGEFFVRHFGADILLKVKPPIGKGAPVNEKEVMHALQRADTISVDEEFVARCVKNGTNGGYEIVGGYNHVAGGDATFVVDISHDEMRATITATGPAMSGADISVQMIEHALKTQKVTTGIEEDKISEFVDNPVYDLPYEVAVGIPATDGRDAYIAYDFETDTRKLRATESETGQIDFKELNLIQNVIKGGRLAQKIPPERGKSGKTVLGRYLEAKNGKDISIPLGQNVSLAADGMTVVADCDGQVMLSAGKITVEPVLRLKAVDIKTGNIKFLGSVIVRGNVEDGFNVDASGNVEIGGTVGNCKINAGGNIVVSQGIFGKDEGVLTGKKSLWAKFIQSAKVEVDDSVVVIDSIMNSEIVAMKSIVLNGKKAQITGGHLFATEEISARNIGSPGGTETILEVGFDPRAKLRLDELQKKQTALANELESVKLDISTLENQRKIRRSLPKDKEDSLTKLMERYGQIEDESAEISSEVQTLQDRLRDLRAVGKVKASGTVYAGVKVYVRDVVDEVHSDVSSVTFYFENNFVKRGKYEQAAKVKGPDGYTAN